MALKPITVSQLNDYISRVLMTDPLLGNLTVTGEISNLKYHSSGHLYFSITDQNSKVNCFFPAQYVRGLHYALGDGLEVVIHGYLNVYKKGGTYTLFVRSIEIAGAGGLAAAFQLLKEKLEAEGLFDPAHKKPIPQFPRRIGIVTSNTGAAVRDIIKIIESRTSLTDMIVFPVLVQGSEAAADIAGTIDMINRDFDDIDTLIVGRGGGSMEDLWAFNDERVVRAIADSHIPVISAVGHEPDVTISDFVADLRAATPSNAAELAVPDQTELRQHLAAQRAMLLTLMTRRLKQERQRVTQLAGARALRDPKNYIDDRRMQLDYTQRRLIAALQRLVAQQRERFVRLTSKLDAMSPLKVLSRGYSMTFDAQGHVVRSVRTLSCGDRITVRLADGRASAEVREIQEDAT